MKQLIRRFVDWMERSPAYKTIWFFPLLFVIAMIAWAINRIRESQKGYIKTQ